MLNIILEKNMHNEFTKMMQHISTLPEKKNKRNRKKKKVGT